MDNLLNDQEETDNTGTFAEIAAIKEERPMEQPKKNIKSKWDEEEDEEDEASEEVQQVVQTDLLVNNTDFLVSTKENSSLAGVQCAIGNFERAVNLLRSQVALSDASGLKQIMSNIYMGNYYQLHLSPCLPAAGLILRNGLKPNMTIHNLVNSNQLEVLYQKGLTAFSEGEREDSLSKFKQFLKMALFFVTTDSTEEKLVRKMIEKASEYVLLIRLNLVIDADKSVNF